MGGSGKEVSQALQVGLGALAPSHEAREKGGGKKAEVPHLLVVRCARHLGVEDLESASEVPNPGVGPESVLGIEGQKGPAVGLQDGASHLGTPPRLVRQGAVDGPRRPKALPVIHGEEVEGPESLKLGACPMGPSGGRARQSGGGRRRSRGDARLEKPQILPRNRGGLEGDEDLVGICGGKGHRAPQRPGGAASSLPLHGSRRGQRGQEEEGKDPGKGGRSGRGPSERPCTRRRTALFRPRFSPHLEGPPDTRDAGHAPHLRECRDSRDRRRSRAPSGPLVQMLTIDIHAHIGSFAGYDLSEATLLAEVAAQNLDLALVSNIDGAAVPGKTRDLPEEEANGATVRFVRSYPDRFRGLLWGRPDRGDASALEPFTLLRIPESPSRPEPPTPPEGGGSRWTSRLFVGLKLHPEMNRVPADDPALDPYLAFAARHHLPVVVHCDGRVDEASAPRFLALGRRHPGVPIVLYHTGFGGPHAPAMAVVEEALSDRSADLWLETSQLPPEVALEAVERVGAERVLFGTDATFFGTGHYARYRPLLDALKSGLPTEAVARVLHGNALELFRLRPERP